MAPFEALYSRRSRSPIGWFESFEVSPRGTDLLRESLNGVRVIQNKLRAVQNRQKSYVDRRLRALKYGVSDRVFL